MLFKKRKMGWREEDEDLSSYWMTVRIDKIVETAVGSTSSHAVENGFGKGYGSVVTQTE